jgi:hypothetical protein
MVYAVGDVLTCSSLTTRVTDHQTTRLTESQNTRLTESQTTRVPDHQTYGPPESQTTRPPDLRSPRTPDLRSPRTPDLQTPRATQKAPTGFLPPVVANRWVQGVGLVPGRDPCVHADDVHRQRCFRCCRLRCDSQSRSSPGLCFTFGAPPPAWGKPPRGGGTPSVDGGSDSRCYSRRLKLVTVARVNVVNMWGLMHWATCPSGRAIRPATRPRTDRPSLGVSVVRWFGISVVRGFGGSGLRWFGASGLR